MFWKKQESISLSHRPLFTIEVDENSNVLLKASWVKPQNNEELASLVKRYVGLMLMMYHTRLFPMFQKAISIYGEKHNDSKTAESILYTLDAALKENVGNIMEEDLDGPVVTPTEAFHR